MQTTVDRKGRARRPFPFGDQIPGIRRFDRRFGVFVVPHGDFPTRIAAILAHHRNRGRAGATAMRVAKIRRAATGALLHTPILVLRTAL